MLIALHSQGFVTLPPEIFTCIFAAASQGVVKAKSFLEEMQKEYIKALENEDAVFDNYLEVLHMAMTSAYRNIRESLKSHIICLLSYPKFMSYYRRLVFKYCQSCYSIDWNVQMGALCGITACLNPILQEDWLSGMVIKILYSLVTLLKACKVPVQFSGVKKCLEALTTFIWRAGKNESQQNDALLTEYVQVLSKNLFSENSKVRLIVQNTLSVLAKKTDRDISSLLKEYFEPLFFSECSKNLHSISNQKKIGLIEGIVYCFSLRPVFLSNVDRLQKIYENVSHFNSSANREKGTNIDVAIVKFISSYFDLIQESDILADQAPILAKELFDFFSCENALVFEALSFAIEKRSLDFTSVSSDSLKIASNLILTVVKENEFLPRLISECLPRFFCLFTDELKNALLPFLLQSLHAWSMLSSNELHQRDTNDLSALFRVFGQLEFDQALFIDKVMRYGAIINVRFGFEESSPLIPVLASLVVQFKDHAIPVLIADTENSSRELLLSLSKFEGSAELRKTFFESLENILALDSQSEEKIYAYKYWIIAEIIRCNSELICEKTIEKLPPLPSLPLLEYLDVNNAIVDLYCAMTEAPKFRNKSLFALSAWLHDMQGNIFYRKVMQFVQKQLYSFSVSEYFSLLKCVFEDCSKKTTFLFECLLQHALQILIIKYPAETIAKVDEVLPQFFDFCDNVGNNSALALELITFMSIFPRYTPSLLPKFGPLMLKSLTSFLAPDEFVLQYNAAVVLCMLNKLQPVPIPLLTILVRTFCRTTQTEMRYLAIQGFELLLGDTSKIPAEAAAPWLEIIISELSQHHRLHDVLHFYAILETCEAFFYPYRQHVLSVFGRFFLRMQNYLSISPEIALAAKRYARIMILWDSRAKHTELRDPGITMSSTIKSSLLNLLLKYNRNHDISDQEKNSPDGYMIILENVMKFCHGAAVNESMWLDFSGLPPEEMRQVFARSMDLFAIYAKHTTSDATRLVEVFKKVVDRLCDDKEEALYNLSGFESAVTFFCSRALLEREHLSEFASYVAVAAEKSSNHFYRIALSAVLLEIIKRIPEAQEEEYQKYMPLLFVTLAIIQALFANKNHDALLEPFERMSCAFLLSLNAKRIFLPTREQKKFFETLCSISESTQSIKVCRCVLQIAGLWISEPKSVFPTNEHICKLLNMMASYEFKQNSELFKKYLEKILEVVQTETAIGRHLEGPFLLGTVVSDIELRSRFIAELDKKLHKDLAMRIYSLLFGTNWYPLAGKYYLSSINSLVMPLVLDNPDVWRYIDELQFESPDLAHELWVALLPKIWGCLHMRQREKLTEGIVNFLIFDGNDKQKNMLPSVCNTMLSAVACLRPLPRLPPNVVSFVALNHNSWHSAIEILNAESLDAHREGPLSSLPESNWAALNEIFVALNETDMELGLARKRCNYPETMAASSFEIADNWVQALEHYEDAMEKARHNAIVFNDVEFNFLASHWKRASRKLNSWGILYTIAEEQELHQEQAEAMWRLNNLFQFTSKDNTNFMLEHLPVTSEWAAPRGYILLTRMLGFLKYSEVTPLNELENYYWKCCSLVAKELNSLPRILDCSHNLLLSNVQSIYEMWESIKMIQSLSLANPSNLPVMINEVNIQFLNWRKRMPNFWDDISIWTDLQRNRTYTYMITARLLLRKKDTSISEIMNPTVQNGGLTNANVIGSFNQSAQISPMFFCGFQEASLLSNRFCKVLRKQGLKAVALPNLPLTYSFPAPEQSEVFEMIKETIKTDMNDPKRFQTVLQRIQNLSGQHFTSKQASEISLLRARLYSYCGSYEDANKAFISSLKHIDAQNSKVWAHWGEFQERLYENSDYSGDSGIHALNCYLHTVNLYRTSSARNFVARILWMLAAQSRKSMRLSISLLFQQKQIPPWYYVMFIPQLLHAIANEKVQGRHSIMILESIARTFPCALFFPLRTMISKYPDNNDFELLDRKIRGAAPVAYRIYSDLCEFAERDAILQPIDVAYRIIWDASSFVIDKFSKANGQREAIFKCVDAVKECFRAGGESLAPFLLEFESEVVKNKLVDSDIQAESCEKTLVTGCMHMLNSMRSRLKEKICQIESAPEANFSKSLAQIDCGDCPDVVLPGQYMQLEDFDLNFVRVQRVVPFYGRVLQSGGKIMRKITFIGRDASVNDFYIDSGDFKLDFGRCKPASNSRCDFNLIGDMGAMNPIYKRILRTCDFQREFSSMQMQRLLNVFLSKSSEASRRSLRFEPPLVVDIAPRIRFIQLKLATGLGTIGKPMLEIWDKVSTMEGCTLESTCLRFANLLSIEKREQIRRQKFKKRTAQEADSNSSSCGSDKYDEIIAYGNVMRSIRKDTGLNSCMRRHYMASFTDFSDLWAIRKKFANALAVHTFIAFGVSNAKQVTPTTLHFDIKTGHVWSPIRFHLDLVSAIAASIAHKESIEAEASEATMANACELAENFAPTNNDTSDSARLIRQIQDESTNSSQTEGGAGLVSATRTMRKSEIKRIELLRYNMPKAPVPFRLTPGMQEFVGACGLEGPFSASIMSLVKAFFMRCYRVSTVETYFRLFFRDHLIAEEVAIAEAELAMQPADVRTAAKAASSTKYPIQTNDFGQKGLGENDRGGSSTSANGGTSTAGGGGGKNKRPDSIEMEGLSKIEIERANEATKASRLLSALHLTRLRKMMSETILENPIRANLEVPIKTSVETPDKPLSDLVKKAVDPYNLTQMPPSWMPYL